MLELLPEEVEALAALGQAYGNLGDVFIHDEGTIQDIRLAAVAARQGAAVLDRIADRLQAEAER
jgi:hypothetical protein